MVTNKKTYTFGHIVLLYFTGLVSLYRVEFLPAALAFSFGGLLTIIRSYSVRQFPTPDEFRNSSFDLDFELRD